ncbi:uncharacterized protein N7500_008325 [Penicillium coprophilum]|uniref:uncharacterized protein n=1 Tax=Penicillium coprophilum TaxID=36646 RepID=UPI002387964A|nr:uncharacterized protein N7500_008325 [Penicillium coprophilum]KAJ5158674.1 hypothetical protein N7500_008325 [Penicillium coprophilum]
MSQHPSGQEGNTIQGRAAVRVSRLFTNMEGNIHELPHEIPTQYPHRQPFNKSSTCPKSQTPKTRKAKLVGYALAKWGDYPMLIDGEHDQEIPGCRYIVQTDEETRRLVYDETNAYKEAHGLIYFIDEEPSEALGKTLVYAGDAHSLLEQRSDRHLWLHQMTGKVV